MSRSRSGLSFADAPAIVIFCALAAYLVSGLFAAAGPQLRFDSVTAKVVETDAGAIQGLALPSAALRQENGEDFVWVAVAGRLEKKKINILFRGDGFCLARRESRADSLREGDRVVTEGEELYEGKTIT